MENANNAPSADTNSTPAKLQEDFNNLYWKYSAQSNALYSTSLELFQTNPIAIEKFDDKIKNRIVKELYWYDNFEDAKAILWDKFYSTNEEKEENKTPTDDISIRLEKLEREKRETEYKLTQSTKSQSINKYKTEYSTILEWIEDLDNKIEEELKLISTSVDTDTRVKYAMSIVKDKYWNKVNFASRTSGWAKPNGWWEEKPQRNPELARLFWNKL